jgi:hypothetical protein
MPPTGHPKGLPSIITFIKHQSSGTKYAQHEDFVTDLAAYWTTSHSPSAFSRRLNYIGECTLDNDITHITLIHDLRRSISPHVIYCI